MTDISQPRTDDQTNEFEVAVPSPPELMKRRAKSHLGFILGGSVVLFALLVAIFAPLLAPADPYDQDLTRRLIDPIWGAKGTWDHPLGTDALGRDYLSRIMFGSQVSLMIGFFAAAVSAIVGSCIGMIGGYFGGRIDSFVMYLINVKLALPGLLVALSLVSVFGGSIIALILILSF